MRIAGRARWGVVSLLTAGHFTTDFYAIFLSSLVPNLKSQFHLSGPAIGVLAAVSAVTGSVSQPFAGWIGDRMNRQWAIVAGAAGAAVLMSLLMAAPSAPVLFVLVAAGGVGVSLFHPNAGRLAGDSGGTRRGLAMAIFISGGALGLFAAPAIIGRPFMQHGLTLLPLLMVPGLLVALLLALAPLRTGDGPSERPRFADLFRRAHAPLYLLVGVGTLRAFTQSAYSTFLQDHGAAAGWSRATAGDLLSAFLLSAAVGGMLGGLLSDRVGRKRVIIWSCLIGGALLVAAPQHSATLTAALLVAGGLTFGASTPVCVVMAQETAPSQASAATGLVTGFSWGIGALPLPAIGAVSDAASPALALRLAALAALLAGLLAFTLRETNHRPAPPVAVV